MKRIVFVILAVISLPLHAQKKIGDGIKDLATEITTSATKQEKQRIAVLPFRELDGQPTVLGTYLAEELVTDLFQLGNFKIVERQLLDKVMGELKIEQSGAIDPKTAKEIGRIAAVDAIVTGSITDLESFVAVNCRLIDTTTGEVFGAAQTKIIKDDDVRKIMAFVLVPGGTSGSGPALSSQPANAIATKDIGSLRVVLKSVLAVTLTDRNGQSTTGIRCSLELTNREARKTLLVALNAEPGWDGAYRIGPKSLLGTALGDVLRTTLVDDHGTVWTLSSSGLSGIGIVSTGWDETLNVISPTEIASLLDRQEATGSSFLRNEYRFVWGSPTAIQPGQNITVFMNFIPGGREVVSGPAAISFQIVSEIVVGVQSPEARTSYSLQNLAIDRIGMPSRHSK